MIAYKLYPFMLFTMFKNSIFAEIAVFLLSCFLMIGEWAYANEITESESFKNNSKQSKNFFDADFGELKFSDNRLYPSATKKRERLRDTQNKLDLNRNYFEGIFSDIAYTASSPSRWDHSDWIMAGSVAVGTGFFIGLDEEIRDVFKDNRSSTTDDFANLFEPFGNGVVTIPALATFYVFGHYDENDKAKQTALIASESFLVTGLYTTILKVSMGRH